MNVLTLDIETMANEGYFWHPGQKYIGAHMMTAPTIMLSFSAKWLGKAGKPTHVSIHDGDMLYRLHSMMESADAIITYNGEGFDFKHINREFVKHGLTPVRPVPSIDLYKFVKKNFSLPYNSLDYVAEYFLGIKKLETGGFSLWTEFCEANEKAIRVMERYNNRDVVITEKLYKFLKPHIRNHPYLVEKNVDLGDSDTLYECPCCGTKQHQLGGYQRRTRCFAIRQVRCDCGHWFDGKRKKLS
jgi:DNA polymerase elongation subunit (family B)